MIYGKLVHYLIKRMNGIVGIRRESIVNFVAIDFETANEKLSSSCAIGIAVVKDSKIIETNCS